jgi:RsiW-degrading membrane proteinase PrsW (M82 family)
MARRRDPVEAREDGEADLYEISTWEVRSLFDRIVVVCYSLLASAVRLFVVALALLILLAQFALGGLGALTTTPLLGAFTLLSVVPALALAAYIWYADVTSEPLELLVATFVLGVLFAGFAGVINSLVESGMAWLGLTTGIVGAVFQVAFFYLIVGPGEEAVKLLAVRLYAYRTRSFDAVVDGAVYGAVAGLGFATIENALYITRVTGDVSDPVAAIAQGGAITAVRSLVGPGHVIFSAFAGYYLGLAKFNSERAGPIVLKGIVIAALIHATYNTLSSVVPGIVASVFQVNWFVAFIGFVIVYDGFFGLLLLRKIDRYRRAYHDASDEADEGPAVELAAFDG